MNHEKELRRLQLQIDSAVKVFTNTIKVLEDTTAEHEAINSRIQSEIESLKSTSAGINKTINSIHTSIIS